MININYNRLFNLGLTHNYYEGEKGRGICIEPTQETLRKFRDGNMLFKKLPRGITVLYRAGADELAPLVKFDSGIKFTFSVHAENWTEFLNITNLDQSPPSTRKYQSGNVLYFKNDPTDPSTERGSPEVITHELIDSLRSQLFTYQFTLAGNQNGVKLKIKNAAGNFVTFGTKVDGTPLPDEVTVPKSDDGSYARSIDLRNQSTGKYTIYIRKSGSTLKEEVIYVDDELASRDILGIVDIKYDQTTLYGDTEEYSLQFSRKETIWKYFIVNKNPKVTVSIDDLIIDDATTGTNGYSDPSVYSGGITFTNKGKTEVNGVETVVFKSDNAIPFFEIPNAFIKLVDSSDGSVLLEHLPNPSHSGVVKDRGGTLESEIYVFI